MKQQLLTLALALLAPLLITSVEQLKTELKKAVEKQRGLRLIRWSLWGWKIRWSVRDRDVEDVLRAIDEIEARDVQTYLGRLVERLA